MMAKRTKRGSRAAPRKASTRATTSKSKKGFFHKILTAEGWKRLMMGRKKSK